MNVSTSYGTFCSDLLTVLEEWILGCFSLYFLSHTHVSVKVYPGQRAGGIEADMMAANELNAHSFLQVG